MGNGSREGSHIGGRQTPKLANVGYPGAPLAPPNGRSRVRAGAKRSRADEDEDEDSEAEEEERPPVKRSGTNGHRKSTTALIDNLGIEMEGGVIEGEIDGKVYCTCGGPSYGEMIGCDAEGCDIEWVCSL